MVGPADDIKSAVKGLGISDPMAQIGTAMDRAGQAIGDAASWARDKVNSVMQTPQGTTKGTASRDAARKRLKQIKVDQADNGGFIVTHHYQPEYGGTPAPEKHVFSDYDSAHAHLTKHMGAE